MEKQLIFKLTFVILFLIPNMNFGQAPDLGTASTFALFTASGAFNEYGSGSAVIGDAGNAAGAFNMFPPGTIIGQIHVADATAAQAGANVLAAYGDLAGRICGTGHGVLLGNGEVLVPNVYCLTAASTLTGILTLDAGGDPNAIFIFKINGAFATSTSSRVVLINSASSCNVFWQVNGEVDLGSSSTFTGTIIASGAINLLDHATLQGRGLSTAGAINLYNNDVNVTCSQVQPPQPIPTMTQWGLIIFGILLLVAGTLYIVQRRKTSADI